MTVLEAVRRTCLALLAIPATVVVVDLLLRWLDARERNPIVSFVRDAADLSTPDALTTVFRDQTDWQTALLALVMYGLLALAVGLIFQGLTSTFERERGPSPR